MAFAAVITLSSGPVPSGRRLLSGRIPGRQPVLSDFPAISPETPEPRRDCRRPSCEEPAAVSIDLLGDGRSRKDFKSLALRPSSVSVPAPCGRRLSSGRRSRRQSVRPNFFAGPVRWSGPDPQNPLRSRPRTGPVGLAAMSVGAREMEISIRNSRPCGPGSVFGSPRPRAGGGYLFAAPPPVNGDPPTLLRPADSETPRALAFPSRLALNGGVGGGA